MPPERTDPSEGRVGTRQAISALAHAGGSPGELILGPRTHPTLLTPGLLKTVPASAFVESHHGPATHRGLWEASSLATLPTSSRWCCRLQRRGTRTLQQGRKHSFLSQHSTQGRGRRSEEGNEWPAGKGGGDRAQTLPRPRARSLSLPSQPSLQAQTTLLPQKPGDGGWWNWPRNTRGTST